MPTDYKVVLCGDYGVGKTSLTYRLFRNDFNDHSQSTIGASFMAWKAQVVNPTTKRGVSLGLWDTAGQERFANLLPMYLRGADVVLFCWDYNVQFDQDLATKQLERAREYSSNCLFYLVMTKIDKNSDWSPRNRNADTFAKEKGLAGIYYTSSLTGVGIKELFENVVQQLLVQPVKTLPTEVIELDVERKSSYYKDCCNIV